MSNKKREENEAKKSNEKSIPFYFHLINGGLSGMGATCVVHPMDVLKNRLQMQVEKISIPGMIARIYRDGGITKFYAGLTAGLLRQASYTTVRLGVYNKLQDYYKETYTGNPSFLTLVLMAGTAGSIGAYVGTPTEVALIRMTSDARLPPEKRHNYKHVIDAFVRIIREEGVTTLWKGSIPTVGRALVVNISQLATYSQTKILIKTKLNLPENYLLYFYASMLSGLLTVFNSMPFDISKTRIQNLTTKRGEKTPGLLTMMFSIARKEGIRALWKGFVPTYCRVGPHTVITLMINEKITNYYKTHFMD